MTDKLAKLFIAGLSAENIDRQKRHEYHQGHPNLSEAEIEMMRIPPARRAESGDWGADVRFGSRASINSPALPPPRASLPRVEKRLRGL
jgi:hypothetical protein